MNTPRNLAAEVAWSVLNKLQPKHCPPKMGEIEVDHGSVLQRVRVKKAFGGMKNHVFVFTKQSKGGFPMNQSKTSDSYFNRWRCEPLPLNQMLLIDDAQIPKCFPTDVVGASEFADEEVTEGYSMLVDEDQTLIGGKSFPFPLEFHASLTEAMLTTFGADVLMAMRPSRLIQGTQEADQRQADDVHAADAPCGPEGCASEASGADCVGVQTSLR